MKLRGVKKKAEADDGSAFRPCRRCGARTQVDKNTFTAQAWADCSECEALRLSMRSMTQRESAAALLADMLAEPVETGPWCADVVEDTEWRASVNDMYANTAGPFTRQDATIGVQRRAASHTPRSAAALADGNISTVRRSRNHW